MISLKDGLQKTSEHECTALRLFRRKKTAGTSQSGHSSPLSKKSTSLSPLHKVLARTMDQQKSLSKQLQNINNKELKLKLGSSVCPETQNSSISYGNKHNPANLIQSLRPEEPNSKNNRSSKHSYRFSINLNNYSLNFT